MKTVLIVEDNALVREIYRSALKPLQVQVIETQQGALAVKIALAELPHLIILDLLLPDIPGQQVLTEIRSTPALSQIPVLAVSNAVTAGDEKAMKALGFTAFVTKPINIVEFQRTVSSLLSERA